MKYLKRYNESIGTSDKLIEFCEESLAYLLDNETLKLKVKEYKTRNAIFLQSKGFFKSEGVSWLDIKEDIIPFIELLSSKYVMRYKNIDFYVVSDNKEQLNYFHLDEINDDLDIKFEKYKILQIEISLKK
jgi:hypothetical protein